MEVQLSVDEMGDWSGKRVLLRVDFNVPLDGEGQVRDDFRIQAVLPTIRLVSNSGGRVVLLSHLGRPDGVDDALTLKPIAELLSQALNKPVLRAPDCIGVEVERLVEQMQDGDILLLENLRFHPEENENDPAFARQLAALGDVYVNDAFASAHRVQASNVGITEHMRICAAGCLMQKEISEVLGLLADPQRPFVAVLGGDDFEEKKGIIDHLLENADQLLLGGKICLPFLQANGQDVGDWVGREEQVGAAREIMMRAGEKLVLPTDAFTTREVEDLGQIEQGYRMLTFSLELDPRIQKILDNVPEAADALKNPDAQLDPDERVVDIGIASGLKYQGIIGAAKTIIWTGLMGDCDAMQTQIGTQGVAGMLAVAVTGGAKAILGGYDGLSAIDNLELREHLSHVSTGHRAFFECLKGKSLPGIEALS